MSALERIEPVDDQTENVLGLSRFGETDDLPGVSKLPAMMSYFSKLANWHFVQPLVPHGVARTDNRPGVYLLWLNPPTMTRMGKGRIYNGSRLAYIGESKELRTRLSGYAMAVNP